MTDTTVHPTLAAIDTLESLAAEANGALESAEPLYSLPDSMNIIRNCEAIIAIHKHWLESFERDYDAMAAARTAAIKRLLIDMFYTEAAKHVTT